MAASSNSSRVEIVLTVDGKEYRREMGDAGELMKRFGAGAESVSAKFSLLKSGIAATFGAFSAGAVAGFIINTSRQFETLNAQLVTTEKSAPRARLAFEQIQQFAASTPYQLEEVVQAFVKLRNMGLDPSTQALTAYGNMASSMGKSLDQMIEAVADAATGEFERLKEFGIRASKQGDQVRFTFQGITTTVKNSSTDIEKYLQSLGLVNFAGGMQRQMDTLGGVFSNFEDAVAALAVKIDSSTGLTGALKGALSWTTGLINELAGVKRPLAEISAEIDELQKRIEKLPKTGRGSGARFAAQGDLEDLRDEQMRAQVASSSGADVDTGIASLQARIAAQRKAVASAVKPVLDGDGNPLMRQGRAVTNGGQQELKDLREYEALLAKATERRKELTDAEAASAADKKRTADAQAMDEADQKAAEAAKAAGKQQEQLQKQIKDTIRQRELANRVARDGSETAKLAAEIELGFYPGWEKQELDKLRMLATEKDAADALTAADRERADAQKKAQEEAQKWVQGIIERGQKPDSIQDIKSDIRATGQTHGQRAVDDLVEHENAKENDRYGKERDRLNEQFTLGLTSAQDYYAAYEQLSDDHQSRLTAIDEAGSAARRSLLTDQLDATSSVLGQMGDLAAMFGKKGFETYKNLKAAEALVAAPSAASKAYEATVGVPFVGPFLAPIAAATAFALQVAQAVKIKSTTYPGRRYGGDARGPREVGEGDLPELMRLADGRTILLPGNKGGTVSPAKQVGASAVGGLKLIVNNNNGSRVSVREMSDGEIAMRIDEARRGAVQQARAGTAASLAMRSGPEAVAMESGYSVLRRARPAKVRG